MRDFRYQIFTKVAQLPNEWDDISSNLFLNSNYLIAQENATPTNMDYFYVGLYYKDSFVGKSVIQRIQLKGKELFRNRHNQLRNDLINLLNLNMLCVGNIKVTGEHPFALHPELNVSTALTLIQNATDDIRVLSKQENTPIKLILFKDFYATSSDLIKKHLQGYEQLSVQPNMVLQIRKDWSSFDDYLAAMKTKYRTRAKRAFKLSNGIRFQEFSLEDIVTHEVRLYDQYINVLDNNSFSVYKLPENYFYQMKKQLNNKFKLFAGFKNGHIVCFYTLIMNPTQIDSGFLGYDKNIQKEYQLYLNMLLKMVEYTIINGYQKLDFSRTALEIKSSVGAEPVEMYGFLKHSNPFMNKVLQSTFNKFYQTEDWVQRNPFKN